MADKEWTLMFYFASDNPLTPSVVSQLKAIKQAGFHPDVNVVTYFDPQAEDTPNHIFDVNLLNKLKSPGGADIGFTGNEPDVRPLVEDKLWRDQMNRDGSETIKRLLQRFLADQGVSYDPPTPPPDRVVNGSEAPVTPGQTRPARPGALRPRDSTPKEPGPKESLSAFLKFCSESYKAKHYMLFILGHGVVVGNDIFLFDEHVDSDEQSLSLVGLGEVLSVFAQDVRNQGAEFELVSFHSCSVSSVEVAHELQYDNRGKFRGIANYMLASQGPAFVGSWPYREIVIRVLKDVKEAQETGTEINVKEMLVQIFQYILDNSSDFLLAGYSFHVALCDLNKVSEMTSTLKNLSDELVKGLADPITRNLILLAHWKAISFWQESYTDLFDFCFCLNNLIEDYPKNAGGPSELMETIKTACSKVSDLLVSGTFGNDDKLIVRTDFAGPTYQYSHGLSVFFPWARPARNFLSMYNEYRFTATSWQEFLEKYFDATRRDTRREEEAESQISHGVAVPAQTFLEELEEDIASICFNNEGPLNRPNSLGEQLAGGGKVDVRDPLGDECTCGSVKNYPRDTRRQRQRAREAAELALPLGPRSFSLFQ